MKQIKNILSIAALVLTGTLATGCVDQLNDPKQSQDGDKTVTLTTTIGLDASTKALTAAGVKTFAVGEQIAIFYKQEGGTSAKAVSEALTDADIRESGRKADFTVTLTNPAAGGAVRYIYPAAMAVESITSADPAIDRYTIATSKLISQDGTLASIAASCDLAVFDGTLTDGAALPASVTLQNRLAILELTVKNASGTSVNGDVTKLSVYDGTNYYRVSRTPADEPIYVALWPVGSDQTIAFCATDGTKHYRKSVTGKTLDRNNIYPVRLTMAESIGTALEFVTGLYTVQDGETLSGSLLGTTRIRTANKPVTVTLDGVDIFSDNNYPGIFCQDDANLVLADGSVNHVTANDPGYAGIFIKSKGTLTISGFGTLIATGSGNYDTIKGIYKGGAGIGGNYGESCGDIVITGGTIIAQGGESAAGIGSGSNDGKIPNAGCGDITISGGNITATGGSYGAGIGTGAASKCLDTKAASSCSVILISGGTVTAEGGRRAAGIGCGYSTGTQYTIKAVCDGITITSGVTKVKATKGSNAPYSIGEGAKSGNAVQLCGIVTIGCTLDDEGDPVGGTTGEISDSPYTYQP